MRWGLAFLAGVVMAVPLCVVVLFGSDPDAACAAPSEEAKSSQVSGIKPLEGFTKQQLEYAAIIIHVAEKEGLGEPGKVMGLMAALQESTLGAEKGWDKPNEDHDAGLFQQRVLPGWYGSLKMVTDPEYGARAFFKGVTAKKEGDWGTAGGGGHLPGLIDYKSDWGSTPESYGAAIQKVQVSAFPNAYTKRYDDAVRLIKHLTGVTVHEGSGPEECPAEKSDGGGSNIPDDEAKQGGVALDNVWQYYQVDEPWRNVAYGQSLAISGCGPTTMASVLTSFYPSDPITPKTSAEYFKSHNGYVPGAGSAHIWTSGDMQKHFGFTSQTVQPSAANARKGINDNALVVISVNGQTPFTSGGHIMMIRGLEGDKFLVGTSSNRGKKESQGQNFKAFSASEFSFGSGTKAMYIVKPSKKSKFEKLVK